MPETPTSAGPPQLRRRPLRTLARPAVALAAVAGVVTQIMLPLNQASAQTLPKPVPPGGMNLHLRPASRPHPTELPPGIRGKNGIPVVPPSPPRKAAGHLAAPRRPSQVLPPEKTGSYRVSPAVLTFLRQGLGLPVSGPPVLTGLRSGTTLDLTVAATPKLAFGLPDGAAAPSFSHARLTVNETADTVTVTASAPAATMSVTIAHASKTTLAGGADVSGTVTLTTKVFGETVRLKGTVSYQPGRPATVTAAGSLPAAAVLAPGRAVLAASSRVTLTTADGLRVTGPATVGEAGHTLAVAVSGAVHDSDNWSLTVTGGSAGAGPLPGLRLGDGATGSITDTKGSAGFDVHATAAQAWRPISGVTVTGASVEYADTLPHGATVIAPGIARRTPWADVTGTIAVAGTATAHGTLAANLASGAALLTAAQTAPVTLATAPEKAVLSQAGCGGRLTFGATGIRGSVVGTGRVTITAPGHAPVLADTRLGLSASGVLTANYPVDRSLLGLGSPGWRDTGYWSSDAATVTGPAGTQLRLPAGLSAVARGSATAAVARSAANTPAAAPAKAATTARAAASTPAKGATAPVTRAAATGNAAAAGTATGTTTYTLSSGVYNFITSTLGIPIGSSPAVPAPCPGRR